MVPQSPEQSNEREKPHQSAQLVEPQCESTSCPNSPSFTLPHIFLFALLFRLFPLLLWPHTQTYFQPDEFWQALEPAHRLVFGTGYLTWEWRNSGLPVNDLASKLEGPCWFIDGERLTSLVGSTLAWLTGRMGSRPSVSGWLMSNVEMGYNPTLGESIGNGIRGWLWPGVFSVLYQGLRVFHLDDSIWLVSAPIEKIPGLFISITDPKPFLADTRTKNTHGRSRCDHRLLHIFTRWQSHRSWITRDCALPLACKPVPRTCPYKTTQYICRDLLDGHGTLLLAIAAAHTSKKCTRTFTVRVKGRFVTVPVGYCVCFEADKYGPVDGIGCGTYMENNQPKESRLGSGFDHEGSCDWVSQTGRF